MGCNQDFIFGHSLHHFTTYFLFFLIFSQLVFLSEGRKLIKEAEPFQRVKDEERVMLRGKIGSRPPRCDGRCNSCGHCEAIQVPINPQNKNGVNNVTTLSTAAVAYARGDYNSNYKPMSWKCKCGDLIFNP